MKATLAGRGLLPDKQAWSPPGNDFPLQHSAAWQFFVY